MPLNISNPIVCVYTYKLFGDSLKRKWIYLLGIGSSIKETCFGSGLGGDRVWSLNEIIYIYPNPSNLKFPIHKVTFRLQQK